MGITKEHETFKEIAKNLWEPLDREDESYVEFIQKHSYFYNLTQNIEQVLYRLEKKYDLRKIQENLEEMNRNIYMSIWGMLREYTNPNSKEEEFSTFPDDLKIDLEEGGAELEGWEVFTFTKTSEDEDSTFIFGMRKEHEDYQIRLIKVICLNKTVDDTSRIEPSPSIPVYEINFGENSEVLSIETKEIVNNSEVYRQFYELNKKYDFKGLYFLD